jgi:transcriptional regulator with XRE-family HTH domain
MAKIDNYLQNLIENSGIKEKKICEVLEMSQPTLLRRKTNPKEFSILELEKLAGILGVAFLDLITNIKNIPNVDK